MAMHAVWLPLKPPLRLAVGWRRYEASLEVSQACLAMSGAWSHCQTRQAGSSANTVHNNVEPPSHAPMTIVCTTNNVTNKAFRYQFLHCASVFSTLVAA